MGGDKMTMIPGAYEPRARRGAVTIPGTMAPLPPISANSRGGNGPVAEARRRELPGWLKASTFAAVLLGAMWLAMMAFFEKAVG